MMMAKEQIRARVKQGWSVYHFSTHVPGAIANGARVLRLDRVIEGVVRGSEIMGDRLWYSVVLDDAPDIPYTMEPEYIAQIQ